LGGQDGLIFILFCFVFPDSMFFPGKKKFQHFLEVFVICELGMSGVRKPQTEDFEENVYQLYV
jgi:hypothetical protein